jgi:hypothetical protein
MFLFIYISNTHIIKFPIIFFCFSNPDYRLIGVTSPINLDYRRITLRKLTANASLPAFPVLRCEDSGTLSPTSTLGVCLGRHSTAHRVA